MIKINNGFVTNSSSTSYIISSKSNKIFSKDEFLKLIGIDDCSLLKETFANVFKWKHIARLFETCWLF